MFRVSHILRKFDATQWGGTETAVQRLITGLPQHHHTVHAPSNSDSNSNSDSKSSVQPKSSFSRNEFEFESESESEHPQAFSLKPSSFLPYTPIVPVSRITAEQRAALLSWGGNIFSWDLLPHLLRSAPDLIHSHALNRIAGIGLLAARLRGIPHVVTLHGGALDLPASVHADLTAPLKGGIEWGKALGYLVRSRRVLELTDAIFTCNPREAQLLQEKYPQQRIIVQPHSVPAAQYGQDQREAALRAFPQIAGRDLILKLARLDPAKNLPWLLRQLPQIKQKHPRAMLALVGAPTTQSVVDELRSEIARLGLENDVLLPGGLPPGSPELIGLLQSARVFVLSSTAEPFGIVILEAWAAGTPVLSSRTSGPAALMEEGQTGLLYEPNHEPQFHSALSRLLTDESLRQHLTQTALHTVQQHYDVPTVTARIARIYEELSANSSSKTSANPKPSFSRNEFESESDTAAAPLRLQKSAI